jgi:1,2-diacylglycerol 3-beta-galactosyltransferase
LSARIDFVFFDAGGGHRAAATALQSITERQQRPWQVRLVNLQELLDAIDIFRRLTGIRIQDCYNALLRRGWTLGGDQLLKVLHAAIRLYHPEQVRLLREFWAGSPPEMVVSLIPNFNRALFEALQAVRPAAPMVTILTDLADYPPHFWIERQPQWVICGSDRAVEQARQIGVPPAQVRRVSGMILRPQFHEPVATDRAAARRRLNLDPETPTGVVLFGGHGSGVMLDIVRRLQRLDRPLQLICICGRNEKLAARLRQVKSRFPVHVEGFTTEIPYFMACADFFIGKPGPGSISEAVAMNLPVIVERNAWTLPQERFNADWVREHELGIVVSSRKEIGGAVERLLQPGVLEHHRQAAARLENRAVFEIPEILAEILGSGPAPAAPTAART